VAKTEFFWAINDWMDATAGLEVLSKRGIKPEGNFRYAIDPLSDGSVEGAYIRDEDTGDTLWRVLVQQRQEFGWGIRGLTQIDLRSDRDIERRFSRD
jgi:lipopolysaccharide assembly outer membrane protein LptD (OstA)